MADPAIRIAPSQTPPFRMEPRDEILPLVEAARKGDAAAFDTLAARFRPTALLIARGTVTDREFAEDAVQDALLVAQQAVGRLDDPSAFGPWLATIVRNRARRLAREGSRRRAMPIEMAESVATPPPAGPCGARAAIDALPEGMRETMDLYYLQDWSVGEIAALLERPVTTVKWQLHAGRALLRRRYGSEYDLP